MDDISCAEASEITPKCSLNADKCRILGVTSIGQIIHCGDNVLFNANWMDYFECKLNFPGSLQSSKTNNEGHEYETHDLPRM